jgi:proline racemase
MHEPTWTPPTDWTRITTVDAHTEGEPFRVVTGGVPEIPGATILERRRWARQHLDGVRKALMWEPRGHADMYGCFVTQPVSDGADLGVLFMHNEGFSTMCGHGIIALTTVAVETGMLTRQEPETAVVIDSPAGQVRARARLEDGRVRSVRFRNVASFVAELDAEVDVPGLGVLRYDLAFGGAFYAYVRAEDAGVTLGAEGFRELIDRGSAIKQAIMASREIVHPFEADLGFLYGVIFVGEARSEGAHSRNVCIFADGELDRSPTGTGVSGRVAIHHARGEVGVGEAIVIESLLGSCFTVQVVETTTFGPYDAIVPEVEGTAHITGRHEFLIDPADEIGSGFVLR